MSRPNDLYHAQMLNLAADRSRTGHLDGATHHGEARNPLCGDRLSIELLLETPMIELIRFEVRGCAIARASAALMCSLVELQTDRIALELGHRFREELESPESAPIDPRFDAFRALRQIRSRRRCATLAWEALEQALEGG
ncbi:MAG: iron-sulfur cluster assembly scaffold protein [Myxococcota bacterium]